MAETKFEKEKLIIDIDKSLLNVYIAVCIADTGGIVGLMSNKDMEYYWFFLTFAVAVLLVFGIYFVATLRRLFKHKKTILG